MSNNRTATSGNDQALPLAAVVTRTDRPAARALPRAPSPTLAAPLAPLPGSALHGGALLRPSGKMSVVRVDLSGGTSHTTYEGAIRQGSCARMGSTIAALVPVSAAASGDGAAVSYAALPTDSLLGRPHILVYGKGGRPESCGAISVSGPIVPVTSAQADSAEASSAG